MKAYTVIGLTFLTVAAILFDLYGFGFRTMPIVATACAAFGTALILGVLNERAIAKENAEFGQKDRPTDY